MKVIIVNGDAEVVIEVEGGYSPDLADDLCKRAVETYKLAFDDDPAEKPEQT